jgi:hypothetical protein
MHRAKTKFARFLNLVATTSPALLLLAGTATFAEIKVVFDHNENETATADFKFKHIPAPSKLDAATDAEFSIIEGEADENGGGLEKLHDGKLPAEQDEPAENFFFNAGTEGGRILVDLRKVLPLVQINTYSWHPDARGPQVYQVYASEGTAENFKVHPGKGTALDKCGWKPLAQVDTRPSKGERGGQYGVSISDPEGSLGRYRYLLFDIARTESDDDFGNTFYSEIDVIEAERSVLPAQDNGFSSPLPHTKSIKSYEAVGGKYRITIDTTSTPDLSEWANKELAPVVQEWYPKLVQLLPSAGYEAPKKISITFQKGRPGIPAESGGTAITCSSDWFRQNLKGEAKGAVVHELVHVIQQYKHADQNSVRPPGWLVEGIPDYLRWFKYEPQNHGADLSWLQSRRNLTLKYDASYRISANFLNWVSEKYAADLVQKVNAALRAGKYNEGLWTELTGHAVQELGNEWKKDTETRLAQPTSARTSPPAASAQPGG